MTEKGNSITLTEEQRRDINNTCMFLAGMLNMINCLDIEGIDGGRTFNGNAFGIAVLFAERQAERIADMVY